MNGLRPDERRELMIARCVATGQGRELLAQALWLISVAVEKVVPTSRQAPLQDVLSYATDHVRLMQYVAAIDEASSLGPISMRLFEFGERTLYGVAAGLHRCEAIRMTGRRLVDSTIVERRRVMIADATLIGDRLRFRGKDSFLVENEALASVLRGLGVGELGVMSVSVA